MYKMYLQKSTFLFCNYVHFMLAKNKPAMGSNPIMIVKYFNSGVCHPHINLIFDILIGHGVVHTVYCDVIVELYCGGTMLNEFKPGGWQGHQ